MAARGGDGGVVGQVPAGEIGLPSPIGLVGLELAFGCCLGWAVIRPARARTLGLRSVRALRPSACGCAVMVVQTLAPRDTPGRQGWLGSWCGVVWNG